MFKCVEFPFKGLKLWSYLCNQSDKVLKDLQLLPLQGIMGSQFDSQQVVEGWLQISCVHLRPAERQKQVYWWSTDSLKWAEPSRSDRVSDLSKSLQGSVLCLSSSAPIWPPLELLLLPDFNLRWTPGNVLNKEEKKKRNRFCLKKKNEKWKGCVCVCVHSCTPIFVRTSSLHLESEDILSDLHFKDCLRVQIWFNG